MRGLKLIVALVFCLDFDLTGAPLPVEAEASQQTEEVSYSTRWGHQQGGQKLRTVMPLHVITQVVQSFRGRDPLPSTGREWLATPQPLQVRKIPPTTTQSSPDDH